MIEIGDHLTVDGSLSADELTVAIRGEHTAFVLLDQGEAKQLRAAITRWLHDDPEGLGD
jgi:hypothetical protein